MILNKRLNVLAALLLCTIFFGLPLKTHATDQPTTAAADSPAVVNAPVVPTPPTSETLKPVETRLDLEEISAEISRCANFKDRSLRLECHDALSEKLGFMTAERLALEKKTLENIGFWQISMQRNELNENKVSLRLDSANEIILEGRKKIRPSLNISCTPGNTELYIDWRIFLVDRGDNLKSYNFAYKIENEPRTPTTWQVSIDRLAMFSPDAVAFVRTLVNKKRLVVEVNPLNESTKAAVFDITGIEKALDHIVNNCYGGVAQ